MTISESKNNNYNNNSSNLSRHYKNIVKYSIDQNSGIGIGVMWPIARGFIVSIEGDQKD